jgi:hypothetical protein
VFFGAAWLNPAGRHDHKEIVLFVGFEKQALDPQRSLGQLPRLTATAPIVSRRALDDPYPAS